MCPKLVPYTDWGKIMMTLEHDRPPGQLRDAYPGLSSVLSQMTPQAHSLRRSAIDLKMDVGVKTLGACHFWIAAQLRQENCWATRFLHARRFTGERGLELLKAYLDDYEWPNGTNGYTPSGHEMYFQAWRVTVERHRTVIDIADLVAGAAITGSLSSRDANVDPIVHIDIAEHRADMSDLLRGLLINPSRN